MKKIILSILSLSFVAAVVFSNINTKPAYSHTLGAPAGYAGDPFGGNSTCASGGLCHAINNLPMQTGWLTSNIPPTGYVPGTTYTITATATRAGHVKFGFEVTPQNASGTMLGTLISTSASTQLTTVGGRTYVTHTQQGTRGTTGFHTWTFNWKAPVAGTGTVTFYGAFNITNADSTKAGDTTATDTMKVIENKSLAVYNLLNAANSIKVFPNPIASNFTVNYNLTASSEVTIELYSIDGKMVSTLFPAQQQNEGSHTINLTKPENIKAEIYLLRLITAGNSTFERVIVE